MFGPGNLAGNSPPKDSNSPLERFQVFQLLLFEVQPELTAISTRTRILMHVSKAVKALSFGATVLLGFSAFAPKALAQG